MKPTFAAVIALAMLATAAAGQTKKLAQGPNRIELTLERLENENWRAVDPAWCSTPGTACAFVSAPTSMATST